MTNLERGFANLTKLFLSNGCPVLAEVVSKGL